MGPIVSAIVLLSVIGAISALLLYVVSRKFYVHEDANVALVEEVLPAANCGGCGYPGCKGFAEACVSAETLDDLSCPVGGTEVMGKVAAILGKEVQESLPMIAVVRCNGTCENRPVNNTYDGVSSCAIASILYGGETGCSYGCLGFGDCVDACVFEAIQMNTETRLPDVIEDACTSCDACIKACPKNILELRKKGLKSRRVHVSCVNKEKGATAQKACSVACIACKKCQKACAFDAITIENNLAYINYNKCTLCRKCVEACPTNAIQTVNFPPKREKQQVADAVEQS